MSRLTLRLVLGVACLLGLRGAACCPAPRLGADVRIGQQDVLITWDAESRTEHFVRRANFDASSQADAFGFLVPSPSMPTLAEVDDRIFEELEALAAPEVLETRPLRFSSFFLNRLKSEAVAASDSLERSGVVVLGRAQVAGYEAVILEARDQIALTDWLKDNGFVSRPEIAEWAEPYIRDGWKITAFRYDPEAGGHVVQTQAVHIRFQTDRPLFPYRTPKDNRQGGNLLRIYYVGDERVEGGFPGGDPWNAAMDFSAEIQVEEGTALSKLHPGKKRLTVFKDPHWPGGEEDLYFQAAASQEEIRPDPIVIEDVVWVPVEGLVLLCATGGLLLRRWRKK